MREQDGVEMAGGAGAREAEETQAHHARRPMNAFLIFCKRHRAVVRDKYPNLENRSITKILGEWWANLDEEEKACYTGLAKQYKDAFFSANPDFKWYKLPAPPLRTLAARAPPDRPSGPPPQTYSHQYPHHQHQLDCDMRTNNNSTKYDYNKRRPPSCDEIPLTMFTPGKLADEAHMGGISRLLLAASAESNARYENPYSFGYTQYSTALQNAVYPDLDKNKPRSKEESIRELQNALTETSRIFEDLDEKTNAGDMDNPHNSDPMDDNFTNQEIIDKVIDRGLLTKDETDKADWAEMDRRSGRSCKGKRYQEFMAVGGLLANKRARRDERDIVDYGASTGWEYTTQGDYSQSPDDSSEHDSEQKLESKSPEDTKQDQPEGEVEEKPFKAADFDLDAKIRALPSLSLEKFQEKKRENKKKKKSSFSIKPKESPVKNVLPPNRMQLQQMEARREAERWRETVIGSQKRKPRKISITRLEVNSMVNRTGELKTSPEIKMATEAPRTHTHGPGVAMSAVDCSGGGGGGVPVDLFALATLAEVASNTCKIEEGATHAHARPPPASRDPVHQYRV